MRGDDRPSFMLFCQARQISAWVKRTSGFGLFLLDAGGLDHFGPLLSFRSDEVAEISG
jgi:hypothetical protein